MRKQVLELVSTGEPFSYCMAGLIVGALADSFETAPRQAVVWQLLAARRGGDCRRHPLWFFDECRQEAKCRQSPTAALGEKHAGYFADIERRAIALESKIAAGKLAADDI
jgi:hypothetical protein